MIRVGVIGIGKMGNHHSRILSEMQPSLLGGVSDVDASRAEKTAQTFHTQASTDFRQLFGKVQAVVISAPTPYHYEVGRECLEQGLHCLIEEPLCTRVEEAEELIRIARKKNLILQVGHVERFNPAVIAAREYIRGPRFIEAHRLGPYDPRVSHIGVVLDLMIHDLDIVLYLVDSKVKSLEADGASVISEHEDIVKCRLRFENGCVADISASRVSPEPDRKIRIFQPDAYISVDYARKDLRIYRKRTAVLKSMTDIEVLHPSLSGEETLKLQLQNFIHCIENGGRPHVTGEHGRDALALGLEILKQLRLHPVGPMARFLISAGDYSADVHGEFLVQELKALDPSARVMALGGCRLRNVSDVFLHDLVTLDVSGFTRPILQFFRLKNILTGTVFPLLDRREADAVILIDYYGFNIHVARRARARGIPVFYFVSPQVWASRPYRIRHLKETVSKMLVIFPFEEELYRKNGVPAVFVGHPFMDRVAHLEPSSHFRKDVESGRIRLGLVPGSRKGEISRHIPLMEHCYLELKKKFPALEGTLFAVDSIPDAFDLSLMRSRDIRIVRGPDFRAKMDLTLCLTSSGTATLENALLGMPMVVVYRTSWPTYCVVKSIARVPYISMPNILCGKEAVPEFIQHKATPGAVLAASRRLLDRPELLEQMHGELIQLRKSLGRPGVYRRTAEIILKSLA